jgi:hypothetical protein
MNRSSFLRAAFSLAMLFCAPRLASAAEEVTLVVDRPLPAAAKLAVDDLRNALVKGGFTAREATMKPVAATPYFLIGLAGKSQAVDAALAELKLAVPDEPESLVVKRIAMSPNAESPVAYVVAGRDERGLTYAVRDVERTIATWRLESLPQKKPPLETVIEAVESPQLRTRAIGVHLFNADVEREWYYSEEFWRTYLKCLSLDRFNQLSLTFSDQCNYLCPVYPHLVEVPEYSGVKAEAVGPAERERNLKMLRRISELCDEYAIDFHLSIWMQAPVPRYSAPVKVSGLPEGLKLADYSAKALRRVLDACPSIRGVQLRMNEEAGVPAEQQTEFYRPLFQAIRTAQSHEKTGRPIALHLRLKGLQASTTQAAVDEKLDVTVSTKFWSEHFGLPYHPTSVDTHWREDRYSFGAMLAKPRPYRVIYQLWNQGSNRITAWGDPDYAKRFAESCRLGDGEGFEVFAPLTNKGYGDKPGAWPVVVNKAFQFGKWEQERYWFFYLCFGRLGYNADAHRDVWLRECKYYYIGMWDITRRHYQAASQVLPLITAAQLPGASEWSWWPEMDTGGGLREAAVTQPSDPRQFYAISKWKKTEGWRWEDWDAQPGYVEDLMAGKLRGKWTPPQVAAQLIAIADEMRHWRLQQVDDLPAEFRIVQADFDILENLARYHAARLLAATELALAETAGQSGRLSVALEHLYEAFGAWEAVVAAADPVYHRNLVFGIAAESPRSKLGHHHTGHWTDRTTEIVKELEKLQAQVNEDLEAAKQEVKLFPGEDRPVVRPEVEHDPLQSVTVGKPVVVRMKITGGIKPTRVVLHHRPLDQTRDWHELEMTKQPDGTYTAEVPAAAIDARFDWQYYFEAVDGSGGGRWPDWTERQPYIVVPTTTAR